MLEAKISFLVSLSPPDFFFSFNSRNFSGFFLKNFLTAHGLQNEGLACCPRRCAWTLTQRVLTSENLWVVFSSNSWVLCSLSSLWPYHFLFKRFEIIFRRKNPGTGHKNWILSVWMLSKNHTFFFGVKKDRMWRDWILLRINVGLRRGTVTRQKLSSVSVSPAMLNNARTMMDCKEKNGRLCSPLTLRQTHKELLN